jgi:hypothetical protein
MVQVVPVVMIDKPDALAALVERYGTVPMVVRIEPAIFPDLSAELVEQVRTSTWDFAVSGLTRPVLSMLPAGSQDLQLTSEIEALRALQLEAGPGLVDEGWDHTLPTVFARNGIRQVLVSWGEEAPLRPGVTDQLGEAVTVIPMVEFTGEDLISALQGQDPQGMIAVLTQSPRLGELIGLPTCQSTTLSAYLAENHAPQPLHPPVDRDWRNRIDHQPYTALLYRRMLRMAVTNPARLPAPAASLLMAAQSGPAYSGDPLPAYQALLHLRSEFENELRRGYPAAHLAQSDWDGDTVAEVLIEGTELSLAVDPADGTIPYLDHLPSAWPIGWVSGEGPIRLARTLRGQKHGFLEFSLLAVEETRSGVGVDLIHPTLTVEMRLEGAQLILTYRPNNRLDLRLGPELPLRLDPASSRVRVDGGEWWSVSEPSGKTGHRFRLEDHAHQVLVQLAQPGDLFFRPAADGLLIWVNWPVGSSGEYRVTLTVS